MKIKGKLAIMALAAAVSAGFCAEAQEKQTDRFAQRYDLLVSKLGADGVGIETLLNAWEKEDSTDLRQQTARFNYYFAKSRTESVVTKPERKYLGMDPVLHLKDSTGTDVYYYQEYFYDDSLFSMAVKTLDKSIKMHPDRLDLRLLKADALNAYEKGSPDMTLAYLNELADAYFSGDRAWEYPGDTVNDEFFKSVIQQYCAIFFSLGTPNSYDAFKSLSEKMLAYMKDDTTFMDNLGSYMLVAQKDPKTALKWYNKVLKIKPDDYTAIKNGIIVARSMKNLKLEKKYLQMMTEYGPSTEQESAKVRLNAMNSKKK